MQPFDRTKLGLGQANLDYPAIEWKSECLACVESLSKMLRTSSYPEVEDIEFKLSQSSQP